MHIVCVINAVQNVHNSYDDVDDGKLAGRRLKIKYCALQRGIKGKVNNLFYAFYSTNSDSIPHFLNRFRYFAVEVAIPKNKHSFQYIRHILSAVKSPTDTHVRSSHPANQLRRAIFFILLVPIHFLAMRP